MRAKFFLKSTTVSVMAIHFLSVLLLSQAAISAELSPTTQKKLALQWQHYALAHQLLINASLQEKRLTRAEWESAVNLTQEDEITSAEQSEIQRYHAQLIADAKAKAIADSIIDLNEIRKNKTAASFCEALPKGGLLHIHPGGTIDIPTGRELLTRLNPAIDPEKLIKSSVATGVFFPQELDTIRSFSAVHFLELNPIQQNELLALFVLPEGPQPFSRFNAVFGYEGMLLANSSSYDPSLDYYLAFLNRAKKQHVSYVEFTSGASFAFQNPKGAQPLIDELREKTGIEVRFNYAFHRDTNSYDKNGRQMKSFLQKAPPAGIVGIDLLGDESNAPALETAQNLYGPLAALVDSGQSTVHRTQHAGELGDVRNPRDAMIMGAERIGHGVKLREDEIALEYARLHHVAVEINLVSNERLEAIDTIENHPYLDYLRLGLPVSLSTDDEGILDTTINHDCEQAIDRTDVTYAELKKMAFNSIETAFVDSETKQTLLESLKKDFDRFEAENAF